MASWMIHLRIADNLLDRMDGLSAEAFIMGNIAPDSGVPNEDWSQFTPSTAVSHFRLDNGTGKKKIDIASFVGKYFTSDLRRKYDKESYSFFLGYLTHLLTDCLWSDKIAHPAMDPYLFAGDRQMIGKIKADWYDLDHLYLRQNPDFRSFRIYRDIEAFPNTYMDIFSRDAFDNRRAYIVGFYQQENHNLDREYPFLTQKEYDLFVKEACVEITELLNTYFNIEPT